MLNPFTPPTPRQDSGFSSAKSLGWLVSKCMGTQPYTLEQTCLHMHSMALELPVHSLESPLQSKQFDLKYARASPCKRVLTQHSRQ